MHHGKGRPYLLLCFPFQGNQRRMLALLLLELLQLQAMHHMSPMALTRWDRKAKRPKSNYLLHSSTAQLFASLVLLHAEPVCCLYPLLVFTFDFLIGMASEVE